MRGGLRDWRSAKKSLCMQPQRCFRRTLEPPPPLHPASSQLPPCLIQGKTAWFVLVALTLPVGFAPAPIAPDCVRNAQVKRIINEPTAAALAFGVMQGDRSPHASSRETDPNPAGPLPPRPGPQGSLLSAPDCTRAVCTLCRRGRPGILLRARDAGGSADPGPVPPAAPVGAAQQGEEPAGVRLWRRHAGRDHHGDRERHHELQGA